MKTELIWLTLVATVTLLEGVDSKGCPPIISRAQWGARARGRGSTTSLHRPLSKVFIHHTETGGCATQASCSQIVRSVQNYHMNTRGWSDIGYNFLVGGDGKVYEGRGWSYMGAHVKNWNKSYGISFIGRFGSSQPSRAAISAAKRLIACGRAAGNIAKAYTLHGHRDGGNTDCPGNALYNLIKGWPNFRGKL